MNLYPNLKRLVFLFLLMILFIGSVHASGKMEVKLREKVTLKVEDIVPSDTYKWIVKTGSDIISTQTGTQFSYTFDLQGEYQLNLQATDDRGKIKTTSVAVLAGDKFPRPASIAEGGNSEGPLFTLTTLPTLGQDGRVHLLSESSVMFKVEGSPDILEYRIDRNVFEDSDGNGVANDDIDNANDESYLRGGLWKTDYKPGESTKITAEVTVVTRGGLKAKKQAEMVFDEKKTQEGPPIVLLNTLPAPSPEDQVIYLYGERARVGFYVEHSEGQIQEYRIDKNIFFDSNGDKDPGNDIDNLNHPSFKTGDIWDTVYEKTDDQIIAQVIVVGPGGKGSRIQRAIQFTDKPQPSFKEYEGGIKLVADKDFALKGDPVRFSVVGLQLTLDQYTFAWDFNGDGEFDKEIQGNNTADTLFETPGVFNVKVKILDREGHAGERTLEMLVKETVKTLADFEFTVEANQVTFKNISTVALGLANKELKYQWSFGDTDEESFKAQKAEVTAQNPAYTYKKAGKYLVTLTITDADEVASTKSAEVEIAQDLVTLKGEEKTETSEEPVKAEGKSGIGAIILKILKVILYIILIVLILILFFVGGFIIFLKLKHPELAFDELLDEMKRSILRRLGIEDDEGHPSDAPQNAPAAIPEVPPTIIEEEPQETPSAPPKQELPREEVIEGQVEEPKTSDEGDKIIPPKHPPETGELNKQEGPVPDWLKGI